MYMVKAQPVQFSLFVIKLIHIVEISAEISISPSSTVIYPETSTNSEDELITLILPTTTDTVHKQVTVKTPLIPISTASSINLGYGTGISKVTGPSLVAAPSPVTTLSSNTVTLPTDNVDVGTTAGGGSRSPTDLFTDLFTNLPSELLSLIAIVISSASLCCMILFLVGCILSSCRSRRKCSHVQDEALRTASLQRPLGDAVRDKFQLTVIENPSLKDVPSVPCAEHKKSPVNNGMKNSVQ